MSHFRKYIITATAVILLVPGIFSWILFKINSEHIYSADRQRVELVAEIIKNGLKDVMFEGGGVEEFQRFLDQVAAKDVETVRLYSEEGAILNSTVPDETGKSADEKYMKMFRSLQGASLFTYEHDVSRSYSGVVVINNDLSCRKCHSGSEKISVFLGFEISAGTVDRTLSHLKKVMVLIYFIGAVLFLVPVYLIGRYLRKKPLDADSRDGHMEKMASIGEAVAIFAHGIKNPLAGISGALQVMAEEIPEGSPRKQICHEMMDEIERLDTAVKDLLAYGKTTEPHLILTDINAMIERACIADRSAAGEVNVEIKTVLEAVPEVMIDQEQMGKVFVNMIRNAISRMPGGGTLTVTTQYRKDRGEIEIAFLDTGREIPEEKIRDVFEPFFSTKQLGTGLKMALSRNIVESHKGRMKVVNRAGVGCSFNIIIPCKG